MSVISFAEHDLFIFRTIKHLASNPSDSWANSYEFEATMAGDSVALDTLASILVIFEQAMTLTSVHMDRVIVSTWEEDSKPYSPLAFMSIPQNSFGAVTSVSDALPLSQTLSIARVASSGRFGHIFLRGALTEADTSAPAGKAVLSDPGSMQGLLNGALVTSELSNYGVSDTGAPLRMVMVDRTGETVRPVHSLVVQGIAQVKTDHKWFNRTPSGP